MAETRALPPPREEVSPEKMTFLEHLDELRQRIIRAVLGLLVAFVLCFTFSTPIFEFLMGPLQSALPPGGELIATAVPEIFVLHLKMSFFVAIFLSSPIWLSQVWLFISPFGSQDGEIRLTVSEVFSFYSKVLLAAGAVFQIPTVIFLLARMGLVTASFLWKNFKYAVLIIFIVAAVLTPPDVVTQTLMATPMVALYLFSIGVAWLVGRDRQKPPK